MCYLQEPKFDMDNSVPPKKEKKSRKAKNKTGEEVVQSVLKTPEPQMIVNEELPSYEEMQQACRDLFNGPSSMETQPDLDPVHIMEEGVAVLPDGRQVEWWPIEGEFDVPNLDEVSLQEYLLDASKPLHTNFVLPEKGLAIWTQGISSAEGAPSDANNTKFVYCVNNFGHSLFNQMNVSFNGVLMTEQSNAYHQKAYLETLQNFNRQEGETTLAAQGWVNEHNVKEELTPTNAANDDEPNPAAWSGKTGLKALTSRLLGKAYHTFIIKPHIVVFRTGKCLVPNVQIDLELYLNDSNMFLFGTPDTTTTVNKKDSNTGRQ
ncbi:unnamed protein product [Porites lobata]|uniref:Uncharacterized protein n=1 Tax=Porites lobata TaxID=104759 RepID=A0ABN8NRD6_9CNID|nr:unnamed protein product [Porites lobata]